jgi:RND family efflux transporter MFP subunit
MHLPRLITLALPCLTVVLAACGSQAGGGSPATGGGGRGRGDGRGASGRGGSPDRPIPVEIERVRRGSVSRTATIAGILQPVRTVGVNAQLAGVLLSVRAAEGTRVKRGQLLAEVDTRELQAQERSAEASLRLGEANFQRSEQLFRQKIITAVEYDRDRAAFESARATLDGLRTRLGYARIASPTDGIVTEKRIEEGDVVSNQTRLFTIADVSMLVTRVQVSELEVRSLAAGDTVPLTVDALGGERVTGRIRRVFPAADSSTRLVPVEVALTGPALQRLKPGYTVRATFALDLRRDVLLVPSRSVSGPIGARAVYVVSGGKVARRAVSVGPDLDGNTEVRDGLRDGDSVIVSGASMLREGAIARVVGPLGDDASPARARGGMRRDSTSRPPARGRGR